MVNVAIAGGTGPGLAASIVNGILNHPSKHSLTVLSRSPNTQLSSRGIKVVPVDYSSHESLVKALEGVHTLISTIWTFDATEFRKTHLALLAAAKQAGVKRFAPSEWAGRAECNSAVTAYNPKADV